MKIQSKVALVLAFTGLMTVSQSVNAAFMVASNASNQIAHFDINSGSAITFKSVTGLGAGESLIGIDLRPSNDKIYGLTTAGKLYTIDPITAQATIANTLSGASFTATGGVGIDFNPTNDFNGGASLRVTTGAGNNYAVNLGTSVVGNTSSNIGAGHTAAAYTNSIAGTNPGAGDTTDLFYINTATDTLEFLPNQFNNPAASTTGGIVTIGGLGLGFNVLAANGFDITSNGIAYAALTLDDGIGKTGLYQINLTTGAASFLKNIGTGISGLTQTNIAPVPLPGAALLFGPAVLALGSMRKRAKQNLK